MVTRVGMVCLFTSIDKVLAAVERKVNNLTFLSSRFSTTFTLPIKEIIISLKDYRLYIS